MSDAHDRALKKEQVATPRAQATSAPPPAAIRVQAQPHIGRRVLFDGENPATDSFFVLVVPDDALRAALIGAMKRLAGSEPGLALLNSLSNGFFDRRKGSYPARVELHVLSELQRGVEREAGHVEPPEEAGAPYKVYIKNYKYDGPPLVWAGGDHRGTPVALRGLSLWPPITGNQNAWCTMSIFFLDDAPSMMAECLYHELLHVLFLEQDRQRRTLNQPPRDYPTGHADQMKCEIDPDFHRLVKSMVDALNKPYELQRPPLPGTYLE